MSSEEVSVSLLFFPFPLLDSSSSMLMQSTSNTGQSPTSHCFTQHQEQNKNLSVTALNALSPWGEMSTDGHKWQK